MKELLQKKAKNKNKDIEVKEQYIEAPIQTSIIRDDIDSVPELPKMTEKNPEKDIDFFKDPSQGLFMEDLMDT